MGLILEIAGIKLHASQDELYEFIINVITARPSVEDVSEWIEKNSKE